jgi:hypothetical protein
MVNISDNGFASWSNHRTNTLAWILEREYDAREFQLQRLIIQVS